MRITLFATLLLCLASCNGASPSPDAPGAGDGGSSGAEVAGRAGTGGGASQGGASQGGAGQGGASQGGAGQGGASQGGAGQGGASQGGASQGGASALAAVQAIFDARCVTCHDKSKLGLPAYPALSLIAGDTRASLVNKAATETCGGTLVVPGLPQQSYLIRKLSQDAPCEGVRMPRPFEVGTAPPLSSAEMTTIESWISAGAP